MVAPPRRSRLRARTDRQGFIFPYPPGDTSGTAPIRQPPAPHDAGGVRTSGIRLRRSPVLALLPLLGGVLLGWLAPRKPPIIAQITRYPLPPTALTLTTPRTRA